MRNILEYPISFGEKYEVMVLCAKLLREHIGDSIGGIQEAAFDDVFQEWLDYNNLID